jgi:hypothetical protein
LDCSVPSTPLKTFATQCAILVLIGHCTIRTSKVFRQTGKVCLFHDDCHQLLVLFPALLDVTSLGSELDKASNETN